MATVLLIDDDTLHRRGAIEAHSSGPETGSEFVVYLPLYHADGAGAPRDMA